MVTIAMSYPGASPEEVERGIILAIEEAVQGLDDIKEVTSVAREGSATVTVEIVEGKNIQRVAQDIQNAVDRITSFPDEAEDARVTINQRRRYVVSLALYGNPGERILRETAEMVRDRLLQDPGITQVDLAGIRDYEISISVPQATLRPMALPWKGWPRRSGGRPWNSPAVHQNRKRGCPGAHDRTARFRSSIRPHSDHHGQ